MIWLTGRKADDDVGLRARRLQRGGANARLSAFKDLDCSSNVYWGTSAGRSHYFGDYFRGLAYAMSWPLVCPDSDPREAFVAHGRYPGSGTQICH